jgi:hypothetical protein
MGYTHYWYRPAGSLDQGTWDKLVNDMRFLHKHMPPTTETAGGYCKDDPLVLTGCYRFKAPQFNKDMIWFNGGGKCLRHKTIDERGESSWEDTVKNDLGHETFAVHRTAHERNHGKGEPVFACCKTARKPYDLMVCACLILLKHHFGKQVEVCSDGDEDDWAEAFKFIGHILPGGKEIVTEIKLSNNLFERCINKERAS